MKCPVLRWLWLCFLLIAGCNRADVEGSRRDVRVGARSKAADAPMNADATHVAAVLSRMPDAKVTAYRLDGYWHNDEDIPPNHGHGFLHGWPILEKKRVRQSEVHKRIRQVLASDRTYGEDGAACFWPGMAFTWREGSQRLAALICLKCNWVHFYEPRYREAVLSDAGVKRLQELYDDIFPQGTKNDKQSKTKGNQ